MGDGAYQLVGRLELHPDGACTRLVWKCAWDLAKNPYRRYFDLALRWAMRRDFAAGLENLKALVESPAKSSEAAVVNPGQPARRCWAEIDLVALRHISRSCGDKWGAGVQIMAVVKANAYGHGVGPVARALVGHADMFGVANVTEAEELRRHVPDAPVFILGPALPDERARLAAARFIPSVSTVEEARAYAALAGAEPLPVHLVIDTGMGRIGILEEDAVTIAREILALPPSP